VAPANSIRVPVSVNGERGPPTGVPRHEDMGKPGPRTDKDLQDEQTESAGAEAQQHRGENKAANDGSRSSSGVAGGQHARLGDDSGGL
jgi:hypothetical protein